MALLVLYGDVLGTQGAVTLTLPGFMQSLRKQIFCEYEIEP